MPRKLQTVVVGYGFNPVFSEHFDDCTAGFSTGLALEFDQLAEAGFALVEAQDVTGATGSFDEIRFPISMPGSPGSRRSDAEMSRRLGIFTRLALFRWR